MWWSKPWGNFPEAHVWDTVLTDSDGPYLELMVGCWSDNQPDYSWIDPYETRTNAWSCASAGTFTVLPSSSKIGSLELTVSLYNIVFLFKINRKSLEKELVFEYNREG